jgi:hypothetical protein
MSDADKELWVAEARDAQFLKWLKERKYYSACPTEHMRVDRGELQRKYIIENSGMRAAAIARWCRADINRQKPRSK